MKKTLRYLLIAVILSMTSALSVANATAQGLAKMPETDMMHSTSTMQLSGTHLPQAAVEGTTTTYDQGGTGKHGHIRRGADPEDTPPDTPQGPNEDPIGDAMIPLALLAAAYALLRVYRRKRRV